MRSMLYYGESVRMKYLATYALSFTDLHVERHRAISDRLSAESLVRDYKPNTANATSLLTQKLDILVP